MLKKEFFLLLPHAFSKLANALVDIFIIIYLAKTYGDNSNIIGIVFFFKYIPYLLFGLYGGYLADQIQKINLIIFSELMRAVLSFTFCIYFLLSIDGIMLLCVSLFLMTSMRCFYQPAQQSLVVDIVKKEDRKKVNSYFQAIDESSEFAGPVLLGFFYVSGINIGNEVFLFVFVTSLYLFSSILFSTKRKSFINNRVKEVKRDSKRFELESFKIIFGDKNVFSTVIGSSLCIFFISSIFKILLPIYFIKNLGLEEYKVSYIYGVISVSTLLGAILFSKISSISLNIMFYWVVYALSIIIAFSSGRFYVVLMCLSFAGFTGAMLDICIVTNIQRYSQRNLLGKTFGIFSTFANVSESISSMIIGYIVLFFSVKEIGITLCILCIVTAIIFYIHLKKDISNEKKA